MYLTSRPLARKSLLWVTGLLFLAQILFLVNLQFPRTVNFDEFHYVPSAKQFLSLTKNQNWEHPPLGKELMAVGIGLFGDKPFGWRIMSTIFGVFTLAGMYALGLAVFEEAALAMLVTLISLFNNLLYVQARIGMLDTFMMGFLVWGLAAFVAVWKPHVPAEALRRNLYIAGACFGLTTACKWFGIIPWASCVGLAVLAALFRHWGLHFAQARDDWYEPEFLKGVPLFHWILALCVVPCILYFLTFIPLYFVEGAHLGFFDLFTMQKDMWFGQLSVGNSHPYMSTWKDWPLLGRPIWYAYDQEPAKTVRGVLLMGNPFVMLVGLAGILACVWDWVQTRDRKSFLIFFLYLCLFASWVVIPRKVAFYYYYYPAGMILSLALVQFTQLAKNIGFLIAFVYSCFFCVGYLFKDTVSAETFLVALILGSLFFGLTRLILRENELKLSPWILRCFALVVTFGFFAYFFPILAALKISTGDFENWMFFRSWI